MLDSVSQERARKDLQAERAKTFCLTAPGCQARTSIQGLKIRLFYMSLPQTSFAKENHVVAHPSGVTLAIPGSQILTGDLVVKAGPFDTTCSLRL